MNKKNAAFLVILAAVSCANNIYASTPPSNPVSLAYLRDVLYNLRGDAHSWSQLCVNNATTCTLTPATRPYWSRMLNATNLLPQLGFSEDQAITANSLLFFNIKAGPGASANGPTLSFTGAPGTFATCRLHTLSGAPLQPRGIGGGALNAVQIVAGETVSYSAAPIFGTGGQPPAGETYPLLCVVHTLVSGVATPVAASSGAMGGAWSKGS